VLALTFVPDTRAIELRLEAFNAFNHAQFYGAAAVNGNVTSPSFGQIVSAAAPRQMQAAVRYTFSEWERLTGC
jgi:hypothetical protein